MARIRTIKPEFWSDASVVSLAFEHRLLFLGLWTFADDAGFIENNPRQIKINVFPTDDVDVAKGIRDLKKLELVEIVRLDGKSVVRIVNWRHQRIDKPQPSRFSAAYDEYQGLLPIPRTFHEHSRNVPAGREGKGEEGRGEERKGKEGLEVGGGGHLSSADAASTPEPWRCPKHQGVDEPCHACKLAKAAHKAAEAQAVLDAKTAARASERAQTQARKDEQAKEAAAAQADPDAAKRAIAKVRAALATKEQK